MIRRLARLVPIAFVALATTACPPRGPEAPTTLPGPSNILLITVDTLRADHLSSYGYPRKTSPTLDRLAREGVRFANPSVQWPKTTPSFASLFTATYGKDNGIVRKVGMAIPCQLKTLAERLKDQGYTTHAVVANGALGSEFAFNQGFDSYLEPWKMAHIAEGKDPVGAEVITNLAITLAERIQQDQGRPFFLWVHYLDPHTPYQPPGEAATQFQNDEHWNGAVRIPIVAKEKQEMLAIGQSQVLDGRDELAFYVARYDAEIRYNDGHIERLLDDLARRGLLNKTLTVFTSDHGESLGDQGYYFDHGRFGFQSTVLVPLVFHYPGVLEPRVIHEPVELIHLAPTILEAAGVALPDGAWMQGRSLTPRLLGQRPPVDEDGHIYAYSEAGYEVANKWQKIVRDERFKLIYAQTRPEQRWIGGEGVRFVLYDLENDPGESKNVVELFPEDATRLKRKLALWDHAPAFPVYTDPQTCGGERDADRQTIELLKSLGYMN